jgi:hypothetical protein
MRHLNNVKLPDLAKEYSDIRRAIIESKLGLLTSMPLHTPLEQPPFVGSMNFSGQMWETMLPQAPYMIEEYGGEGQIPYGGDFE